MTDPAGSHGSFGIDLGAGVSRLSTNSKNRITAEELGQDSTNGGNSSVSMPKIWISKGSMLPVDFTFTGGTTRDRSFASAGGIIQVTVFEARSLPAVSFRAFHGRTFGRNNTKVTTNGGEAAISMGFLSYVQAYVTAGITGHHAELAIDSDSIHAILLKESSQGDRYTKQWRENSRSAGLKFTLLPGRLSLAAETTGFARDKDAFNIRLTTFL